MYGQLLNLLDRSKILRFSRESGGERYVKHFDAWQHLVIMLYAVIKRFDSLREITDSMFRIMLMYYVNCYTFLEHPERDWLKIIEIDNPPPGEPTLFD